MSKLVLLLAFFVASAFCGDFNVKNSCGSTLWIEGRGIGNNPIAGYSRITRADPGQTISYHVAPGTVSTRFWAKYGCDGRGANCAIGDQVPNPDIYGSAGCPPGGCQPPIDSLFEATWGFQGGRGGDPNTWFDTSSVDGFTIPYKVTFNGPSNKCDCNGSGCQGLTIIDATHLDVGQCPTAEDMSTNGKFPQYRNQDLRVKSKSGQYVGCQSPCKKFTNAPVQGGLGVFEGSQQALYYCCPTPSSNCQPSQGCVSSKQCQDGPGARSQFVQKVHSGTNGMVYAYQYDDLRGLHTCPAVDVTYTMEFCPPGSAPYPPGTSGGNSNTNAGNTNTNAGNTNTNAGNTNNGKSTGSVTGGNTGSGTGGNNNNGGGCPPGTCPPSLNCCNSFYTPAGCYLDANNDCTINDSGKKVLCGKGFHSCGAACYNPSQLACRNGQLGPK